jgi:hypothetical protein
MEASLVYSEVKAMLPYRTSTAYTDQDHAIAKPLSLPK